ncbi:type I restriction endonuclease subunit R [Vibrio parahaemolyticus]|uniref:type I restriction endonuclease subunit R n=1 Tax=Vibrio parahaemolyticus TaxID=670 RepID=UPI001EEB1533|nr:DEAD/DEAH box helicase family protein [Vibrio parahaemolyticus]MCG6479846.1 DEAD/DEAH box helicase family protein [Vibrio parahaemolyticus]HCG6764785.1 type I restriction endonuclease subunit R [Vibrio parahaemolyticus]
MKKQNEDSRVKIPSILHLVRLGYSYLSLKGAVVDESTNIFTDIFKDSIKCINPGIDDNDIKRLYDDIKLKLGNEDLGKEFYEMLTSTSGHKLIDFKDFDNNTFNVVTELPYQNGDDSFRPDITLLINGMPLAFIEVKKPNNQKGIKAEEVRMDKRFKNDQKRKSPFRHFANLTQLMVFSNNMEYDEDSFVKVMGAFYATPSYGKHTFNYFREEEVFDLDELLAPEDEAVENFILRDTNLSVIKSRPEFITNKSPLTPTNRLSTSLFSRERLAFMLRYSIAYVKEKKGYEKHVMRYPQIFATKAIESKLAEAVKQGIIWHTQGSGKTALTYFNVKYLTDYYSAQGIVPKFYFIVDRLDLLLQAKKEFSSRGLTVKTVNSKSDFAKEIKSNSATHNFSGNAEITVVNIQKFSEDETIIRNTDYDVKMQRVYFLDEVHRSYKPTGSFLANLLESDPNAVRIGLTGTPLLGEEYNSKKLFGDYIHKYYYNMSIADGYTLRLIREEIASNYQVILKKAVEEIEVLKGSVTKGEVFAHKKFVKPMLKYIVDDFQSSRLTYGDDTIGAMVVCDSSEQAKLLYKMFQEDYATLAPESDKYKEQRRVKSAALILHDEGSKDDRKDLIDEFKDGKIDILFVFNMLLTGFDAKRLKKLYMGRVIRKHNLLQTLTRVNRPYKDFKYGYVVDFADILDEFEKTNKAYFDELQDQLGNDIEYYSQLFKSQEDIEKELEEIQETLFEYDIKNVDEFANQINQISDRKELKKVQKALINAKELSNVIRYQSIDELREALDFDRLKVMLREVESHIDILNFQENLETGEDTSNLLNEALEDMVFMFTKISEEELVLADKLKNKLRQTREEMQNNFDQQDPKFIKLKEELERLFKTNKLNEVSQSEMNANIGALNKIHEAVKELNRRNNELKKKYNGDPKFTRVHKRIVERGNISKSLLQICKALLAVKNGADDKVLKNSPLRKNEAYFNQEMLTLISICFEDIALIELDDDTANYINNLVVKEYLDEYNDN